MSFKLKAILLILGVSLIPYMLIMFFIGSVLKEEYTQRTLVEMQTQLELSVDRIEQYLARLHEDITFMSNMDVMNDVYSNDLDRRISSLFEKKKKALHLEGNFYLTNSQNKIIASSDIESLGKDYNKESFINIDVFSSFDKKKIANLHLEFSYKNLTYFFSNIQMRNYYILLNNKEVLYKESLFENPLSVKLALSSHPEIKIVLQQDREFVQSLLYQYEKWFFLALFIGGLLITLISLYFVRRLIGPIIELSDAAEEVTKNQNYTYQVEVNSKDEIGRLSHSFNTMIRSMKSALEDLSELLNDYLNEMALIALKHGATIDKYIGDAIMLFLETRNQKEFKRMLSHVWRWH